MTVTGIYRLEDLLGIIMDDIESRNQDDALTGIDEIQEIFDKLPDDEDSKYILSALFNGTKLNQGLAQLEVLKDESNFMITLEFALNNEKIRQKIKEVFHEI